jgi:hypothetical protein
LLLPVEVRLRHRQRSEAPTVLKSCTTTIILFPPARAQRERSDRGRGEKAPSRRAQSTSAAEREGASGAQRPVPEGDER